MDIHKNARLTPHGRERLAKMVLSGQPPEAASEAAGVCPRTGRKWVNRFEQEGLAGLQDRSSRPHRLRQPTPPEVIERIESLRRQRMPGKEIAVTVGVSAATVSRVLKRLGLNKLSALEPAQPPRRYEREQPGEMIHIDIKKLGKFNQIGHRITGDRKGQSNSRGVGWEFVHVCIDDASRVAFSKIMKTERKGSAVAFLKAAVAYYASLGVTVERVMTDNGSCYRSSAFAKACQRLHLKHIRTKPYTPRTNGKAERFIQTSLREWAYARAYLNSKQRAQELPFFMHRYNWHRPHASIGAKPPITRLGLTKDNLLRIHKKQRTSTIADQSLWIDSLAECSHFVLMANLRGNGGAQDAPRYRDQSARGCQREASAPHVHRDDVAVARHGPRLCAETLTVVRHRENPFAAKRARLPYKALLRREEPLRPTDRDELEAVTLSIAAGGEYLIYEGMRGEELGCRVIAFDAHEEAQAMQAWIDRSRIADRPRPEPPPDYQQLKVG
jgi:transposase InsO family protein